jgi:hypothetical protein
MERGFLNARCRKRDELLREYGLWCWRMGLPMIWLQARSPHSRLNQVHLDFFTTPNTLTVRGHAALIAISAAIVRARDASISFHGAVWDRVPTDAAEGLARAVFRLVRRPDHHEILSIAIEPKPTGKVLPFAPPAARLA